MTSAVHVWWIVLSSVAVLNIAAWTVSAVSLARHRDRFSAADYRRRRLLSWLSAAYVAGCGFRWFLPRIDLERICLAESWWSSMVVGRSVATVAELCFMAQCALLLHQVGSAAGNRFTVVVSCCWCRSSLSPKARRGMQSCRRIILGISWKIPSGRFPQCCCWRVLPCCGRTATADSTTF